MTPQTKTARPIDLDRERAQRGGVEIPRASNEVLKRIGISRYRWDRLTLTEQMQMLQDRVVRDEAKTSALAKMPPEPIGDPASDSPVVWFVKTWGGQTRYEYTAISTPKGWLVSGENKTAPKTWTEVLQFALLREPRDFDPYFCVASEWTVLERPDRKS